MLDDSLLSTRLKVSRNKDAVRSRDKNYVWHTWTPVEADRSQLTLSHGRGYRVWDICGNEYIDASALNLTCGYNHPTLLEAIKTQMLKLPGADISIVSHEAVGLLAEKLSQFLPENLSRTLFVNSGSEGVEAALFIAGTYSLQLGKSTNRIVAFTQGYHGSTLLSRIIGGVQARVSHPFINPFEVTHVELPVPPNELRKQENLNKLLSQFEIAIGDNPPMAVVIEPFLNVGGGIVLPNGFLRGLRQLCDKHKVLLILDEVFTGYGRSGKMFSFEHEKIVPDILVSSKGLASGYMPIAAVTVLQKIYDSFKEEPILKGLRYGHTTSGHAISCAAGLATLEVIQSEQLCDKAEFYGNMLFESFNNFSSDDVVDVRRFGLVLILEMTSLNAAAELRDKARRNGLLLRQCGNAVMAVPPLIMDNTGIDLIKEKLFKSLKE